MCAMLLWTIYNGDTKKLFAPVSYVGKTDEGEWTLLTRQDGIEKGAVHYCGVDEGFEEYKWLYFTNLNKEDMGTIMDSGICVKECPSQSLTVNILVDITRPVLIDRRVHTSILA